MTTEHTAPHRPLRTWVVADLVSRCHAYADRYKMLMASHPDITCADDLETEVLAFLQMNRHWSSDEDPPTDEEERRAARKYAIVEWAFYVEDMR
jgi:hypothetical protein